LFMTETFLVGFVTCGFVVAVLVVVWLLAADSRVDSSTDTAFKLHLDEKNWWGMTVGSTLLTIVLAAIGVAAFATDPFILAITVTVGLATLTVLAYRLGKSVNPPFSPPTPDMICSVHEPVDVAPPPAPVGTAAPVGAAESRLQPSAVLPTVGRSSQQVGARPTTGADLLDRAR
jgi:hypothetical protein